MKSKIVSSRSFIRVLLPMMDTRYGESLQYHPHFHGGPQRCTRFTAAPLQLSTSTLLISLFSKFCVTETQHSRGLQAHLIRATSEMGLPFPWLKYLSEGVKPRVPTETWRRGPCLEVSRF